MGIFRVRRFCHDEVKDIQLCVNKNYVQIAKNFNSEQVTWSAALILVKVQNTQGCLKAHPFNPKQSICRS